MKLGRCDKSHRLARVGARALRYLRSGAPPLTLNCGCGHGFSVLEVIDAVKRVSGIDFKVDIAPRRLGDPAQIVAQSERVRAQLGWQPRYDDHSTIVRDALNWERELMTRRITYRIFRTFRIDGFF